MTVKTNSNFSLIHNFQSPHFSTVTEEASMMYFPQFSVLLLVFCPVFSAGGNDPASLYSEVSINCGSVGISAAKNGREWIGDKHLNYRFTSLLQLKGTSTTSTSIGNSGSGGGGGGGVDPLIYRTARISGSRFLYTINLNPGQVILRLHFNPSSYKRFTSFRDLFTVEAAQFTLLGNFSASLTAHALGVTTFTKEFCICVTENQPLDIVFSPSNSPSQERTYAFVNGIEVIPIPAHLTYVQGEEPGGYVVGEKSLVSVDNSTALEIIHRAKLKRNSVSSNDENFEMFGMWGAAPKQDASEVKNVTWKRSVHTGFSYLVRIYYSELGLKMAETSRVMFKVFINWNIVQTRNDTINRSKHGNRNSWYRDYLVDIKGHKQDPQRNISISLQSNDVFVDGYDLLKGFEILKLSNPDNSLASPNPLPPAQNTKSLIIQHLLAVLALGNASATLTITTMVVLNIVVYKFRSICETSIPEEENKLSDRAAQIFRRFSLAEIVSATRNFSDVLIIGKGGFGKVYKGVIGERQETVAIKRLKSNSSQGEKEFLTELETLSELQHINLVSLIGYCNEGTEMIIVYEYMSYGTLQDHIYESARKNDSYSPLTWKQRLNICIGAARGIDYLHTGHRLIHRDIKASNILLDKNFVAKVSDFGLAKPENKHKYESHVSTNVKGTFEYLDPYYFRTRRLSRKSDIYAFGVVLLEVLCGRPVLHGRAKEDEYFLVLWAQNKMNSGEVEQLVASCLTGEISRDSLNIFVGTAEMCLHCEPKKRPTMAQVVLQLEHALERQEERRKFLIPDLETRDEVSSPSVATKLLVGFAAKQKHGEMAGVKDRRSLLQSKPLCLFPRNGAKPSVSQYLSGPEDCTSSEQEYLGSVTSVGSNSSYINTLAAVPGETNNFHRSWLRGLFGLVKVGVFDDVLDITVKSENSRDKQALDKSRMEMGYPDDKNQMVLVSQLMKNGSLRSHLYFSNLQSLCGKERLEICLGTSKGLHYLHEGYSRIYHESEDNLLVENLIVNIADVGVPWTWLERNQTHVSTIVKGSSRYIYPDCFRGQQFTDVYSFGVVLFALLCDRPALKSYLPREIVNFAEWAIKLYNKGRIN